MDGERERERATKPSFDSSPPNSQAIQRIGNPSSIGGSVLLYRVLVVGSPKQLLVGICSYRSCLCSDMYIHDLSVIYVGHTNSAVVSVVIDWNWSAKELP